MRKYLSTTAIAVLFTACCTTDNAPSYNDILSYNSPATIWEEYLPLGNGRLGLMPNGGILNEHIILNEISMWSGSEFDYSNPLAAKSLPAIRQLLFEGKNYEAQQLMYSTFVPKATSVDSYGAFQMLGDLNLSFYIDTIGGISDYKRSLDMHSGIASTDFSIGNNHIHREYFASRNDDVITVRLQSSSPISFSINMSRPERGETKTEDNNLVMSGMLNSGQEDIDGVQYEAILTPSAITGQYKAIGDTLLFSDVTDVTLLLSATTSYIYGECFADSAKAILSKATDISFDNLKREHIKTHSELYDRVKINIKGLGDRQLTTDKRLLDYAETSDPEFAVLYYNFGRYSLISSTRPGSLPPNLQGLWANQCGSPWNGDYHTNINVQMNHWPLEQGNLDELYEPLIRLVENSVPSGEKSAKDFYGEDAQGWVMHMMTNVWNFTAPGEHPSWGATNTGGAWLCEHLWERYEYSCDTTYLKRIYPILRGAAQFFHSTMVVEPQNKWLVTAPTSSPENGFFIDGHDQPVSICMGPAMDTEIITELFSNVIRASEIIGSSDELINQLKADLLQLPPLQISPEGYLQEWLEDYKEMDIHHRHVSHLYGLHPSNLISPIETPELADACRTTLNRRGDGGTGWSRAWKINFWARLFDGNRAETLLKSLFASAIDTEGKHISGTYPNLWCSHPPFQLDGNFGGAAGIGEMLLQSHMGYINPLPALPDSWSEGHVSGMKVRGGAEIEMRWEDNKLRSLSLSGGKLDSYSVILPSYVTSVSCGDNPIAPRPYHGTRIATVQLTDSQVTLSFEVE